MMINAGDIDWRWLLNILCLTSCKLSSMKQVNTDQRSPNRIANSFISKYQILEMGLLGVYSVRHKKGPKFSYFFKAQGIFLSPPVFWKLISSSLLDLQLLHSLPTISQIPNRYI